jgi:hypothetical protein
MTADRRGRISWTVGGSGALFREHFGPQRCSRSRAPDRTGGDGGWSSSNRLV